MVLQYVIRNKVEMATVPCDLYNKVTENMHRKVCNVVQGFLWKVKKVKKKYQGHSFYCYLQETVHLIVENVLLDSLSGFYSHNIINCCSGLSSVRFS